MTVDALFGSCGSRVSRYCTPVGRMLLFQAHAYDAQLCFVLRLSLEQDPD
jgi:hypothetical protein